MSTKLFVILALSHGCSFAWHDAHVHSPPMTKSDCPSVIRGVLDTIGAGGFAFVAGEAFVHRNDDDSAANLWVVPFVNAVGNAGGELVDQARIPADVVATVNQGGPTSR